MTTWAAEVEEAPAAHPRPRAVRRQRRLSGGVAWIAVVALLLAGVVATNVAVLRLNMSLDDANQQRADLRAQMAALSTELSSAASAPRIQQLAAKRLRWVQATADQTTYFSLRR
jgi:cell division protein FtsL